MASRREATRGAVCACALLASLGCSQQASKTGEDAIVMPTSAPSASGVGGMMASAASGTSAAPPATAGSAVAQPPSGGAGTNALPAPNTSGGTGGNAMAMTGGSAAPSTGGNAAPATGGTSAPTSGGTGGTAVAPAPDGLRDVLLVGNGVAGTVSFIDATTFENLGSVNILPDLNEVMALINADIVRAIAYPVVKTGQLLHHFEPGGGDRYLDDVFVSPDGTVLYVSRSNLGDVAAFDLSKPDHPQLWRTFVDGVKADHATISPDGSRLVVSATSATVADVIDAATGKIVGSFPTGDYPHQNDYSADGKFIYNGSIGNVSYNSVSYTNNAQKGVRKLVKVNASTLQVVDSWTFEWGIRPSVVTPDDKILYAHLSYLNGAIKYDLETKQEITRNEQPLSEFALQTYATYDEYPHDSAHHGLALSGDGTRLCDCGTIDNTVAIITTADMQTEHIIDVGLVPYWATTSPDGSTCFVSLSGDDAVSIVDYATGELITTVPVGRFPQRSRLGRVPDDVIALLSPTAG